MRRKYKRELLNDIYGEILGNEGIATKIPVMSASAMSILENVSLSLDLNILIDIVVGWIERLCKYFNKEIKYERHYKNLIMKYEKKISEIELDVIALKFRLNNGVNKREHNKITKEIKRLNQEIEKYKEFIKSLNKKIRNH